MAPVSTKALARQSTDQQASAAATRQRSCQLICVTKTWNVADHLNGLSVLGLII